MYLARFSYDISPVDRQQAIDLIRREVKARVIAACMPGCWYR